MHQEAPALWAVAVRAMPTKSAVRMAVMGCSLLLMQGGAIGMPRYVVKEVPTEYVDGQSGEATAINDDGLIGMTKYMGAMGGVAHVCTMDSCSPVLLAPAGPNYYARINGIDRHGHAVGTHHNAADNSKGFLWDGTKAVMVEDYHEGDDCYWCSSTISGISKGGLSVGAADADFLLSVPVLVRPNGKKIPIPTLPGKSASANDIANDGFVVGSGYGVEQQPRPWLYDGTLVTYLPTLGGYAAWANAVNNKHQVVGDSYLPSNQQSQGFLYENGTMVPIPFMYQYAASSRPMDINDRGQVIGWEDSTNGRISYLYQNGVTAALSTRLVKADKLRWQIGEVFAINNKGEIAASASRWDDFPNWKSRAVVLVPIRYVGDPD
jgi:probable HAF family extracellular repeat protein